MQSEKLKKVILLTTLLLLSKLSIAQQETGVLRVGDSPPPLKVAKWLKGPPVSTFERGHLYVVEFGFLSCAPCIAGIPHLSKLARKYAGQVTVISIFVKDEVSQIESFVEKMGDQIQYSLAADNSNETMDASWVHAANEIAYPAIFLIDKTLRIAWIGHNIKSLDKYMEQLIEGSFDATIATQEQKKQSELISSSITQTSNQIDNFTKELQNIDSLIGIHPENKVFQLRKFKILLSMDEETGYEYGWEILRNERWNHNDGYLFELSYPMLYDIKYKKPDYDLAIACNNRVIEITKINMNVALAYRHISAAYFKKGNPQKGEEAMLNGIESIPAKLLGKYEKDFYEQLKVYHRLYGEGK